MSFPPSPSSFPPTAFHPEPLQAVACPTCFGAIAVGPELLGQPAECPLCGSGFRVPVGGVVNSPRQPAAASPTSDAPATRREDSTRKQRRAAPQELQAPQEPAAPDQVDPPSQDSFAELQPSAKPAAELQFQEPVRTVVSGDQVITLRRLTSEEKAARRTRRNLVMMLAGVSILMAIVLLFGTKRPNRRG
jgi:hypothetical protein